MVEKFATIAGNIDQLNWLSAFILFILIFWIVGLAIVFLFASILNDAAQGMRVFAASRMKESFVRFRAIFLLLFIAFLIAAQPMFLFGDFVAELYSFGAFYEFRVTPAGDLVWASITSVAEWFVRFWVLALFAVIVTRAAERLERPSVV